MVIGLSACDFGEQNFDFEPGNSLAIAGPSSIPGGAAVSDGVLPDTASYFVRAFTIEKSYTWTVSGDATLSERRDGEFVDVIFPAPGTYTITVDNGEGVTGTMEVTATEPGDE